MKKILTRQVNLALLCFIALAISGATAGNTGNAEKTMKASNDGDHSDLATKLHNKIRASVGASDMNAVCYSEEVSSCSCQSSLLLSNACNCHSSLQRLKLMPLRVLPAVHLAIRTTSMGKVKTCFTHLLQVMLSKQRSTCGRRKRNFLTLRPANATGESVDTLPRLFEPQFRALVVESPPTVMENFVSTLFILTTESTFAYIRYLQ